MKETKNTAVMAALIGNSLIATAKFTAALLTNSSSMLAEGLHSLADVGNQVLLLVGINRSTRPPDEEHPFGYGKERYFWAFLVAVTMFFVGAVLSIYKGVEGLIHPRRLEDPFVNYIVLGLSVLFECYSLRAALHELKQYRKGGFLNDLKQIKDPTILIVLFEDSAALLGILFAALGVFLSSVLNNTVFDALASVFIGAILAFVAFYLARNTMGFLIGKSASPEQRALITAAIREVPEVSELLELLTMHVGPEQILVNLHVNFKNGLDTDQLEHAIDEVEKKIREAVPEVGRIFVEAESLRRFKRKPAVSR
ncbi:MAG: cation diffusion facilitator family transporter [Bacillota bacterium]